MLAINNIRKSIKQNVAVDIPLNSQKHPITVEATPHPRRNPLNTFDYENIFSDIMEYLAGYIGRESNLYFFHFTRYTIIKFHVFILAGSHPLPMDRT